MNQLAGENDEDSYGSFGAMLDRHPWRHFGILFLTTLGSFHLTLDIFSRLLSSRHLSFHQEYFVAFFTAGVTVGSRKMNARSRGTPEERAAEKQILQQADQLLREARASGEL